MYRFRVPEIFLGCFLTIAIFAAGMAVVRQEQPASPTQSEKKQEATGEGQKAQNPDSELAGSTWLTKDAAGFFAFGLVVVGVGQAILFFFQLTYMRKGMDDATIAAIAAMESSDTAKIQAGVARDTLRTMQDTAERQLRAYVGVSDSSIHGVETGAPEAIVNFKNFGQTPAYDVRMWIHIWITEHPLTEVLPEAPEDLPKATSVLYPGSHLSFFMPKEPPVPAEHIHLLGTAEGTIYVYGGITYRDAFDRRRTTKFRLMYGGQEPPRDTRLSHDTEGNESD
jgi:hypothetical protein